ncbi:MAG: hypothetical protein HKN16_01435 [Saprospiraceae bacterium]|nr:hypothetical protein [Saprospiraceae bacterium]
MFKLISWNIQAGGGTRIAGIARALSAEAPSCIILSEFRNNDSGAKLRGFLLKAGYKIQMAHAAPGSINSVLIASKLPADTKLHHLADANFPYAIVEAVYPAFRVFGVYLPHKKKHKLFPYLLDQIKEDETPAIIAGDFNSGFNFIDQKGDSFWYSEYLAKLNKDGVADAFRHLHGDKKEFSWFSHHGNGFRYDHTYLSEDLLPLCKKCYYLHEWREAKLADHSPMVLELA